MAIGTMSAWFARLSELRNTRMSEEEMILLLRYLLNVEPIGSYFSVQSVFPDYQYRESIQTWIPVSEVYFVPRDRQGKCRDGKRRLWEGGVGAMHLLLMGLAEVASTIGRCVVVTDHCHGFVLMRTWGTDEDREYEKNGGTRLRSLEDLLVSFAHAL